MVAERETRTEGGQGESQSLIQSPASVGKLCFAVVVTGLILAWCVLDTWNRQVSTQLFEVGEVQDLQVDKKTGNLSPHIVSFQFPLTLAFMQFIFMGILFISLWWAFAPSPSVDLSSAKEALMDKTWPTLVVTHVFSTFWLQALMMPTQMMSLGIFAASRAVEIPAAAAMRSAALGVKFGGHSASTVALMCSAAWLVFYSYTQIAECLCIWSGHGVALAGAPLFIIYMMVLTIPAANTVCQEKIMSQLETHPLLMLGLQNLFACLLFAPVLLLAHLAGWEDVSLAAHMITSFREVYMLSLWLCIQMALISSVTVALISMVDSFWAVAIRSLRVVYWWFRELMVFYFVSDTLLSVARPHASIWGFVMFLGVVLAATSMYTDCQQQEKESESQPLIKQSSIWKAV